MVYTKWYQLLFPNPLCYLFERQIPEWIWSNEILAALFYRIHMWTCPDLFRDNIEYIKRKIAGL